MQRLKLDAKKDKLQGYFGVIEKVVLESQRQEMLQEMVKD